MRFVLLGEPATGKSSLLVAFYGALMHRRAGDTEISRTVNEVEFLSRGLEAFGRRQELRRTELDADARLVLELTSDGATVGLELPDRSGELIKHMIDTRTWNHELREQVTQANGAMLFLRADEFAGPGRSDAADASQADDAATRTFPDLPAPPDQPEARPAQPGSSWDDDLDWNFDPSTDPLGQWAQEIAASEHEPGAENEPWRNVEPPQSVAWQAHTGEPGAEDEESAWSPALMPQDVRAIDLLQALLEERSAPLPLVVVLSAWDLVVGDGVPPGAWLRARVPLLAQFLASHADQLPHVVYGVSAQGAKFDQYPSSRLEERDPWDRAFLVGADGLRGTLAEPIKWLISAAG